MTPIEKQSLENQFVIMETLRSLTNDDEMIGNLETAELKTMKLLEPKQSEEPCCEMPKEDNSSLQIGGDCKLCGVKGVCHEMLAHHRLGECVNARIGEKK